LLGEESIKDYKLEDEAKRVAHMLQEQIDEKSIYSTEEALVRRSYEILTQLNEKLDESIELLGLSQKEQKFTLATIMLSSGEVSWITFKSISRLLEKDLTQEDDNSTSQQAIIKIIAEDIFEHVAFRLKRNGQEIEMWENRSEIDIAESPFSLLMEYEVLEEYTKEGGFKNLKLSDSFYKKSKRVYDAIERYSSPSYEPMIVPPREWTTIDDGGFLRDSESSPKYDLYIMKSSTKRDRENLEGLREGFAPMVLEAINTIQKTPWQINSDIIEDINKHLKEKQGRLKQKLKELTQEKRRRYNAYKEMKRKIADQREILEEMAIESKVIEAKLKERMEECKSLKSSYESTISEIHNIKGEQRIEESIVAKARKHQKYEEIFFVWQIDFRGRAYPVQQLLNPQGEDIAKSLLRFATAKPLGESGERWFKIHGANLYGIDKVSFDERVEWVDAHRHDILMMLQDDDKLSNSFLQKADKPYSFLAFAYEYARFAKDREHFVSQLPIAMDGSNNGFQHITALLRDRQGAKKVNVLPEEDQEIPSDIYADVALMTKKLIDDDSDNIVEYINKISIDRDLTKKNVMTEVYGAGSDAKFKQIKEHITTRYSGAFGWSEEQIDEVAEYLRAKIADAIKEELHSSGVYKEWIKKIAKVTAKQNREMRWRTPIIGLEVIQEEFVSKKQKIVTKYSGKKNQIQIRIPTEQIDKSEQTKGIAPNFIHSLDATHLFLTVLEAKKSGVEAFAPIHDSFGTHACDTGILRRAITDSFVMIYSEEVLERFKSEAEERYGIELEPIKYLGSLEEFDIERVRDSLYFFS